MVDRDDPSQNMTADEYQTYLRTGVLPLRVTKAARSRRPPYQPSHEATTWTETQYQREIVKLAKDEGHYVYHTHDSRRSEKGFPDLVIIPEDRPIIFLEVKTQTGIVKPEQQRVIDRLVKVGEIAYIVRPADLTWVAALIQNGDLPATE